MLTKTSGIVLHTLKHSDSSSIATIYTESFGRMSYMVYGVGKKRSVCKSSFMQPLTLVEMDVSHQNTKDIQRIKDIKITYPYHNIPVHAVKNALALFLSELLFRCLRQAESDEHLFDFLQRSLQHLDRCDEGYANFHLVFMVQLMRYLGFEPHTNYTEGSYFDLLNGEFKQRQPAHVHFLPVSDAQKLGRLFQCNFNTMQNLTLSREDRNCLLNHLLVYYRLHIPEFGTLQSVDVLHTLFD